MLLHTHFTPTSHKPFQFSKTHPPGLFLGFRARFQLFQAVYSTGLGFCPGHSSQDPGPRFASVRFTLYTYNTNTATTR